MTEQIISARKNPLIQQVRRLLSSRREREQAGLFVADGTKLLQEAIRWWPGLDTVILSEGLEAEIPQNVRLVRVTQELMAYVSPMESPRVPCFCAVFPKKSPSTRKRECFCWTASRIPAIWAPSCVPPMR